MLGAVVGVARGGVGHQGDGVLGVLGAVGHLELARGLGQVVVGGLGSLVEAHVEGVVALAHVGLGAGEGVGRALALDEAGLRLEGLLLLAAVLVGERGAVVGLLEGLRLQGQVALFDKKLTLD